MFISGSEHFILTVYTRRIWKRHILNPPPVSLERDIGEAFVVSTRKIAHLGQILQRGI
jgi:hypothetical protein